MLDTGFDVKLLKSDLAIKLGLNADSKTLWVINAISKSSELESNQVFIQSIIQISHFIDIKNAWVLSKLDINYQIINVSKLKKDLDHLRKLYLPTLNLGEVPLLLEETSKTLFCIAISVISGKFHPPFAVKLLFR